MFFSLATGLQAELHPCQTANVISKVCSHGFLLLGHACNTSTGRPPEGTIIISPDHHTDLFQHERGSGSSPSSYWLCSPVLPTGLERFKKHSATLQGKVDKKTELYANANAARATTSKRQSWLFLWKWKHSVVYWSTLLHQLGKADCCGLRFLYNVH